ncbi:anti-sigma factor [Microbacterium sp. Mcb102]|uniref:anti-sigma factor n=1 Tax=Microbacterium sp. Mcb102 TaxID=2926012 RepID=UPI0021C5EC2B|nr:anti-sigma factor [Microbacterium sp. Mcb102]
MSHLDPEQLALLALGEPVASAEESAHIAACAACAAELEQMAHAAMVARTTMAEGELEQPGADVWDRIHDELSLSAAVAADPLAASQDRADTSAVYTDSSTAGPDTAPAAVFAVPEDPAPAPEARDVSAAGRVPASSRVRRRRSSARLWILAASLALVVAGGSVTWALVSSNLTPVPVATAELDPFPDHPGAAGSAEVSEDDEGGRALTVTLDGEARADEYREVWLIRNDGAALISLGVLESSSGTFAIPAGVDLAEYDLVDISFEPVDGDPAHSGDSIVRGQLERS